MKSRKVVIIGSGMGGLLTGAILSKNGFEVEVLEKNKRIGGCLMSYSRDGGLFETGVHYIGGLDEGQTLNKIFRYSGILPKLNISRLDLDGFDQIIFGNFERKIDFAQSYEGYIETLSQVFPNERKSLESYCSHIRAVCRRFPLYNLENGSFLEKGDVLETNARSTINSFFSSEILSNSLAANNLLYAGSSQYSPFYIHALITNSYIESAWQCREGGSQIASILGECIERNGGKIFKDAEVKELIEEEKRISKAFTSDSRVFVGDYFISDLHPATTIRMINSESLRKAYINRIVELENSIGVFSLNVTFKEATFPYENHNTYFFQNYRDVWHTTNYTPEKWPDSYAFYLTRGENGYAKSAAILCYMKFSEVSRWKNTYNTVFNPSSRGNGYLEFKERKAEQLFKLIESNHPGFTGAVKSYHTSTPLTLRDYTGTPEGSIYGIVRDYKNPIRTFIPSRTKIENLLLTGQNLSLHGVLGVSVSALVTCGELLDIESLLTDIRSI